EGGETGVAAPIPQGVKQSGENPGPAGTDGVAQGNRAAIDVDPAPVPAQLAAVGQSLNRKGLVGLDEIVIGNSGAGLFHQRSHRDDRSKEEVPRLTATGRVPGDLSQRSETMRLGKRERSNHQSAGSVVQTRSIARGHGATV